LFVNKRFVYEPLLEVANNFSVELVNDIVMKMTNGKAAGLDNLSCEHLKYSHPILITVLCKLFTLFLANGCVSDSFVEI